MAKMSSPGLACVVQYMVRLQILSFSDSSYSPHLTFLIIMSYVIPPPYAKSEAQKELNKATEYATPLEGDRLIFAIDTLGEKARENESALINEMRQLSGYALDIENRFKKVTEVLSDIKMNGASANMRKNCTTLHQKWSEHHNEYVGLLWSSREVACKARSAIEDFSKTVLPYIQDPAETIESKKEELQNQKEKLDLDKNQAKNLS